MLVIRISCGQGLRAHIKYCHPLVRASLIAIINGDIPQDLNTKFSIIDVDTPKGHLGRRELTIHFLCSVTFQFSSHLRFVVLP